MGKLTNDCEWANTPSIIALMPAQSGICTAKHVSKQTTLASWGVSSPELTLRTDDLERDLAAVDVRLSLAALHRQHHQKPENTVAMVLWRTKDAARK
jgi:hypothetical protein